MNRKQRRAMGPTSRGGDPAIAAMSLVERANDKVQAGDFAQADQLYRQARLSFPNNAAMASNHGNILLRLGAVQAAVDSYRYAISIDPHQPAFHSNLGNALIQAGMAADGIAALRQGVALDPDGIDANFNLGNALLKTGELDEAARYLRRTLELKPDYSTAWSDLGNILFRQNKLAEAEAAYRQSLFLNPKVAEVHSNLSNVLMNTDRNGEAIAALLQAIQLKPHFAQSHSNLGNVLAQIGRPGEAIAPYREAIRLDPQYAEPWSNMGTALVRLGRHQEALEAYDRAVAIRPDYAEAQLHRAFVLLSEDRTEQGWEAYRWRWKARANSNADRPTLTLTLPEWDGEAVAGKQLVVYHEQGFGDTIQFCRYAADLAALGAEVTMLVPPSLERLLKRVPGIARVITKGMDGQDADFQVPLMSVPGILGTRIGQSAAGVPYIHADPNAVERWQQRLRHLAGFRVGLVWSGDPRPQDRAASLTDRRRSLTFPQIAPLLELPGIDFVSLQKGSPAAQATGVRTASPLQEYAGELNDFADTAALIATLDLVIAADTSVAHVAGALGKPVWILSRFDGCWRWLRDRDDTPWYPSARLFRQDISADWTPVVARVAEALAIARTG